MKAIPILIGMMFMLSGLAILANIQSVSATTYLSDDFESGIGTWNGGGTLSTVESVSPTHSLLLENNAYEYKNGLAGIFGTERNFNINCSFYYNDTAPGHTTLFELGDAFATYENCWIDMSELGVIGTIDFGNSSQLNETSLIATMFQWHTLQVKVFNNSHSIQMKLDNSTWTSKMWCQTTTGNPNLFIFGIAAPYYTIYYDDLSIMDYTPVPAGPPAPLVTNITDVRVPNQWVLVQEEKFGFPSIYTPTPFVTWTDSEYGQYQIVSTDTVIATNGLFKPGYDFRVTMKLQLEIYDGDQLKYVYAWPMQLSNTNPNYIYQFNNGNASLADAETIAHGYTNEFINLKPQDGHTYYFVYDMRLADLNGTALPTTTFSAVITTQLPMNNQGTWINGLIWILILFTGPWLLNWFLPRYGFIGGMIIMAIALGIVEPSFYYVSIIILATVGIMIYGLSRGD
jgi:hypothetical protein